LKIDSEAILQVRVVARPYVISQGRFRGHFLRLNFTHYGRIYGENREFGGEYFVWAKKFQISKKYFRIFQKSLDISEIEISFPTSSDIIMPTDQAFLFWVYTISDAAKMPTLI
jgi:hypothetical protein